jgi:hypothetical protein
LLRDEWQKDEVLFWQKVAVREYVPLQVIDAESFPNMVPISYEFRFFYFEKKCMAYGPYWYMGKQYSLSKEELTEVLKLTDWAADRIGARFPAIDVAKTASGEWIIIEINDAQESGFVGVNPIELWTNVIKAAQNREWFSPEDFFGEGYVIMGQDPLQGKTIEEMISIKDQISSIQQLARLYAAVDNKYSWLASDMDELAEGSDEYIRPDCPEYIYFTWLFKKYNLISGAPEGKEVIWTIHWECSIKGMPFAMLYDRDYDMISFAVDEEHLSLKEPIAEELKRIIEEEYKRTQR